MPASLYLRNAINNHVLGVSSFTMPAGRYAQMHYGDPGQSCTENGWTSSPPGRQSVTSWTVDTSLGTFSNAVAIQWTNLPDPGVNDEIGWLSIWDASTSGNPLFYGQLAVAKTVVQNDSFIVPIGGFSVSNTLTQDLGDVSGTIGVSFASADVVTMTLTADLTISAFTNPTASHKWVTIEVTQSGDDSDYTIDWPGTLRPTGYEPHIETGSGAVTTIPMWFDGTNYHIF